MFSKWFKKESENTAFDLLKKDAQTLLIFANQAKLKTDEHLKNNETLIEFHNKIFIMFLNNEIEKTIKKEGDYYISLNTVLREYNHVGEYTEQNITLSTRCYKEFMYSILKIISTNGYKLCYTNAILNRKEITHINNDYDFLKLVLEKSINVYIVWGEEEEGMKQYVMEECREE